MRAPVLPGVLAAAWLSVGFVAGCATGSTSSDVAAGKSSLDVRPEWRQFAIEHFAEAVRQHLDAPGLMFPESPSVVARYDPREDLTHLTATGDFEGPDRMGRAIRRTGSVDWAMMGNASQQPAGSPFGPVHRAVIATRAK
jgi:hypothetical protein